MFQHLDANTTLLTPNRRLSATLHKRYQQYQIEQQQTCWQTPDILPLSIWIERLWNDYASREFSATPFLLSSAQEHFLWEKIILHAKESEQLLQISETAEIAKSAWGLLKQWQIDRNQPLFRSAEDYAALYRWTTEFEKKCLENNWIDLATLPDIIIEKILTREITPPRRIQLVGFTEISPQLKSLLAQCEATGSHIHFSDTIAKIETPDCKLISLIDTENEIQTIARYAKSIWEKDSTAKIGCVIPTLEKIRDRVMQIFSEVFAKENSFQIDTKTSPFNISAGKSLAQFPIINTALQLLFLYKKSASIEMLGYLLASPFLGEGEVEHIKRCTFDSLLRKANINHLDLSLSVKQSDNTKTLSLANYCPHLAKRLREFIAAVDDNQNTMTYTAWAECFNHFLTLLGWPGERSLNSEEYQIVESWMALLTDYTSLDQIAGPVNIQQALHTLQNMAAKALFQPKTPEASIQILGVLEAAALPFDYLWITGMDDLSWPPQPKPNPFIPKSLQRELNMPHATAERELLFCQLLIRQFTQSTHHLIFSHAEKNEELELQASPLVRQYPTINLDDLHLPPYQTPSTRIHQTQMIDYLIDNKAPALVPDEAVRGGVNVIKQQALCPFKAFSECRLHAQELEKPLPGLRSKDRGNLIHKVLELFWNIVKDHATFSTLDKHDRHQLIENCINNALETVMHSRSEFPNYLTLEKKRLHDLIHDWLQIEMQRPPFTVMTSEKATKVKIGHLDLAIRIDRIDELSDGKKLIIDYKTGKNSDINSWFTERPEEPQLPLYSLLDRENTVGITFAQVASGETCFKGMSQYSLDIKGIKLLTDIKKATALSWNEQLTEWDKTLSQLSQDFSQGVADVNPKDNAQTCLWCALKPLCRINEECQA